ncbi:MAG TPA: pyridoxamine 5'-phosphate oxidase family protein [Pseudonocardiaceae bacterium]|nr:pyridoxamine 5'-phosphate oxidase family protein [Pseudonocardiaceae bacterium]
MSDAPDLDATARRVIDRNLYLILGTLDPDGRPRLSPVHYTAARYSDFYWVSSPHAHHSRNLAERPDVEIVIFDAGAGIGTGDAVYFAATAREIGEDEPRPAPRRSAPRAARVRSGRPN